MTTHVVFNPSGAGSLRQAIREAGQADRVLNSFDSLSFGPINPSDAKTRRKWVEEVLDLTDWDEIAGRDSTFFWAEALSASDRTVVWTSRRSTQEYAGFLEWLWRRGDEPFDIIDLTETKVVSRLKDGGLTQPHFAGSLALLHVYQIVENGLLDQAVPITPVLRDRYQEEWRQLREENAALRVVVQGRLVSAPITYFDPLLMSHAKPQWQKVALVVGTALGDFWDASLFQTDDLVLAARVRALVDMGQLESQGNLSDIRRSEVRLPLARAA